MGLWAQRRAAAEAALQVVDEHVAMGYIEGDVVVRRGGDLVLRGSISGSLMVRRGGRATVLGRVDEDVHALGGHVEIAGVVLGTVYDRRGSVILHERAYVGTREPRLAISTREPR